MIMQQQILDATTYCSSITACTMAFFDQHAAGIAAMVAVLTFLASHGPRVGRATWGLIKRLIRRFK